MTCVSVSCECCLVVSTHRRSEPPLCQPRAASDDVCKINASTPRKKLGDKENRGSIKSASKPTCFAAKPPHLPLYLRPAHTLHSTVIAPAIKLCRMSCGGVIPIAGIGSRKMFSMQWMTGLRLNASKYDAKNLKSALSPASTETRQNKNPNAKKIAF